MCSSDLSSIREGLPNVVLEAMALSVPVLCTTVAGVPDLVTDGENGMLVMPGEDSAFDGPLTRLLKDSELRRRLGDAGRQTVVEEYSFARRMERVKEIYDRVLER